MHLISTLVGSATKINDNELLMLSEDSSQWVATALRVSRAGCPGSDHGSHLHKFCLARGYREFIFVSFSSLQHRIHIDLRTSLALFRKRLSLAISLLSMVTSHHYWCSQSCRRSRNGQVCLHLPPLMPDSILLSIGLCTSLLGPAHAHDFDCSDYSASFARKKDTCGI